MTREARSAVSTCLAIGALACGGDREVDRRGSETGRKDPDVAPAGSVMADPVASDPVAAGDDTSFSYGCAGEYRFVARIGPGGETARLLLPDTTVTLPHVVSASGARFSDETFTYWSQGSEALIETPERSYTGCVSDEGGSGWADAKERGVDFRAIGQEPGWLLDIHEGDSIAVTTDYGQAHYRFPSVDREPDGNAGTISYRVRTEAHRMTVVIEDEPCRDSMSGWPYETTVSMTLDGREFQGCGRRL